MSTILEPFKIPNTQEEYISMLKKYASVQKKLAQVVEEERVSHTLGEEERDKSFKPITDLLKFEVSEQGKFPVKISIAQAIRDNLTTKNGLANELLTGLNKIADGSVENIKSSTETNRVLKLLEEGVFIGSIDPHIKNSIITNIQDFFKTGPKVTNLLKTKSNDDIANNIELKVISSELNSLGNQLQKNLIKKSIREFVKELRDEFTSGENKIDLRQTKAKIDRLKESLTVNDSEILSSLKKLNELTQNTNIVSNDMLSKLTDMSYQNDSIIDILDEMKNDNQSNTEKLLKSISLFADETKIGSDAILKVVSAIRTETNSNFQDSFNQFKELIDSNDELKASLQKQGQSQLKRDEDLSVMLNRLSRQNRTGQDDIINFLQEKGAQTDEAMKQMLQDQSTLLELQQKFVEKNKESINEKKKETEEIEIQKESKIEELRKKREELEKTYEEKPIELQSQSEIIERLRSAKNAGNLTNTQFQIRNNKYVTLGPTKIPIDDIESGNITINNKNFTITPNILTILIEKDLKKIGELTAEGSKYSTITPDERDTVKNLLKAARANIGPRDQKYNFLNSKRDKHEDDFDNLKLDPRIWTEDFKPITHEIEQREYNDEEDDDINIINGKIQSIIDEIDTLDEKKNENFIEIGKLDSKIKELDNEKNKKITEKNKTPKKGRKIINVAIKELDNKINDNNNKMDIYTNNNRDIDNQIDILKKEGNDLQIKLENLRNNISKNKEQTGEGLIIPRSQPKKNAYKMSPRGYFGDIFIDPVQLIGHHKLIVTDKNGKGLLTDSTDKDLIHLLTKRYNPRREYSDISKKQFRKLVKLSDLPVATSTGKFNLTKKKGGCTGNIKIISDPNELVQRMAVICGEIGAGNNNTMMKNELGQISDILLNKSIISPSEHKVIYNKYLN